MITTRHDGNGGRAEEDDGRVRHVACLMARVVSDTMCPILVVAELSTFPVVILSAPPIRATVESPALDVATVE